MNENYLHSGNVTGVIERVLYSHTIESSEDNASAVLRELSDFYTLYDIRFEIYAFLNKPQARYYAIFTTRVNSIAMFKIEDHIYLFNSHSCTPLGKLSRGPILVTLVWHVLLKRIWKQDILFRNLYVV